MASTKATILVLVIQLIAESKRFNSVSDSASEPKNKILSIVVQLLQVD